MMKYSRILVKLSGEALLTTSPFGIDADALAGIARNIQEVTELGVEVALVVGGGNLFRGEALAKTGFDRVTADHMGILSTVINALAVKTALEQVGLQTELFSTLAIPSIAPAYDRRQALAALAQQKVVILSGGLGLPLISTDSTASLRGIELDVDILLKASTVDAVYSSDPKQNPKALRFEHLSFQEVLEQRLRVMDMSAFCLCEEHRLAIRIFSLHEPSALKRIVQGEAIGTLIDQEDTAP